MRILHILASANLADGGPVEGAVRIGEVLEARGHTYHLATLDDPSAPFLRSATVPVIALGDDRQAPANAFLDRLRRRFAISKRALPWLRAHRSDYDVAIVSGLWNYSTVVSRLALPGSDLPYVVFTHGMLDPWFKRRYPLKSAVKQLLWLVNEGVLLARADRVLFTCEEERILARNSFVPYRAREKVVGFGTADVAGDSDLQKACFRAALPTLGTRRFLLFLSRIHEKKGCDLLVEAFARVAKTSPDLDLVIAGPDPQGLEASLKARAAELQVGDRIHWPGMITGDVKWGAFKSCDAFVLPSHQENFGVVVAEAMACGKPVLTTNKVNIWREVQSDGAGIIFNDDLPSTLQGLLEFEHMDAAARAEMGARGRGSFLRRYRIDIFVDGLENVLLECRAAKRRLEPNIADRRGAAPPTPADDAERAPI